jgi:hypothetical protein
VMIHDEESWMGELKSVIRYLNIRKVVIRITVPLQV